MREIERASEREVEVERERERERERENACARRGASRRFVFDED